MGVARTWVFPIIRIIVFAAIAAALMKLAFFPDGAALEASPTPTGSISEPRSAVTVGTIRNDVQVETTVHADDAVAVVATLAGEVRRVIATAGQWVDAGTELYTIRSETPGEMLADGSIGAPKVRTVTVVAPIAGTLTPFPVLVGQQVSIGDETGKVAPASFHVRGTMAPAQQYRLLDRPSEATVTITGGPAPFTCGGLTIGSDVGTADAPATTIVRCAVPAEVTVFPGLTATLTIAAGVAENVLTVPTTAVEGGSGSGIVHLVLADGAIEERPVTLGMNDGASVEIIDGVAEGDEVLEFLPGAPAQAVAPPGCVEIAPGAFECGMGG